MSTSHNFLRKHSICRKNIIGIILDSRRHEYSHQDNYTKPIYHCFLSFSVAGSTKKLYLNLLVANLIGSVFDQANLSVSASKSTRIKRY